MKAEAASDRLPIVRLAVKASCPVCGAMKHFQDVLAENVWPEGRPQLCNFHAWLLAKSAPAQVAASVFLSALRVEGQAAFPAPHGACFACERIHEEEALRLGEVTRELGQNSLTGTWLKEHARFCRRHLHELENRVPASSRKMIEEWRIRSVEELEAELQEFVHQSGQGAHVGGGVLGRAAEFLVGQRGILE
jgi:hypothetical protein